MRMHALMKRWAKETYSSSNTEEERKTFSKCLLQLRDLEQHFRMHEELPVDLGFLVIPHWKREQQAFHNSDAVKQVYETCIEQFQEIVMGVVK